MKRFLFWTVCLGLLIGAGVGGYKYFYASKGSANGDKYRVAVVRRGAITSVVNSSGTVQPVQSVQVGSFVSGPIRKVLVDFNSQVKAGQVLAEVDPLLFNAQRNQAKAMLDRANADLLQAEAKCEQTKREWDRAKSLTLIKAIADTDHDLAKAAYETAKANVAICEATIAQNKASLELAQTNLGYTTITSPVDGLITDRKVDSGQTVASQFQTPVLFVVAPDLEKKVYVLASVDEADIGLIRDAQKREQPVTFKVDAYPKDTFEGKIFQLRLTPTTVQNVVTYTVVVEAPNPEIKLLPGMTANLSFQIEKHTDVLKVPNAALRFFPKPEQVRERDRAILEGKTPDGQASPDAVGVDDAAAEDGSTPASGSKPRYVWVVGDDDLLSAIKITTGLSDKTSTELISGDLEEGKELVTGMKTSL